MRNRIKRFFEIKKDGIHFLSRFECFEPVMGDGEESSSVSVMGDGEESSSSDCPLLLIIMHGIYAV